MEDSADRTFQETREDHPKTSGHRDGAQGYGVRAPAAHELREVHALIRACDLAEYGVADLTEKELRADWEDPRVDRWVILSPQDRIAGYGSLSSPGEPRRDAESEPARFDVECYVHPDYTGTGIGRRLLRLAEARARTTPTTESGRGAVLTNTVNGANDADRRLLEDEGYSPARHYLRMEIDLRGRPEEIGPPPGITVRPCLSEAEGRAAFGAVEEAFQDHWGHVAGQTLPGWRRRRVLAGSGPGLWLGGRAGDGMVGAVFCDTPAGEETGEIEWLAVKRAWRRRGMGLALLHAAFSQIRARGGRRAGLVVDAESPTGAGRLYGRAGMRVLRHYAVHRKLMRREKLASDQRV